MQIKFHFAVATNRIKARNNILIKHYKDSRKLTKKVQVLKHNGRVTTTSETL